MKRSDIRTVLSFLVVSIPVLAVAQGNSPAAMEQIKMERLWFNSRNAAGTVFDDVANFSNLELSYDMQDGDYHRPQEGEEVTDIEVSSEGFVDLKNLYVWGSFNFVQRTMTDAGYNASITDPFRGMPYYIIDSHHSKWKNQYYDLAFRVASPLVGGRWAFGLDGEYQASIAAKQRDPRVDSRFYTLKLVPGVTYKINDGNKLGLSFRYESVKEDSRMENEDSYTDQDFYILYGLGTAVKDIGDGRETNYYGDMLGGALQYNFSGQAWNVLLEGGYDVKVENVEQSFTVPKKDAGVKDRSAVVSATAYRKGARYSHYVKASYTDRHIDGIQYVSQRDNSESQSGWVELYKSIRSTYKTRIAGVDYSFIRNRGEEYDWKAELGIAYNKRNDEYLLPYSVKMSENLRISMGGKKNIVLGKNMNNRLLVDIHAVYNSNIDGVYYYGGSNPDYVSVTGLETVDACYLNSDYWRMGGAVTYSQQVRKGEKINLFVKGGFDRVIASGHYFSGRSFLSVSAGCNF